MSNSNSSFSYTISREYFGKWNRFCLQTFRTRLATVVYFVLDAEQTDEFDMPLVVVQEDTKEAAMSKALLLA